ncbi:thiopurine S-methyltransferase [Roseivirga pacifica]|uniref:Thiopurine S-methyltransferase (TPMT) n=1 Tax=Roseivirga pacifica TaxID=1267423 RepID=A0A1I0R0G4_9BACT|nr:methyltransferase domain-containing protein [Roseivirga pacifica]RKQ42331.1 thiopurine S-methyltransferase [Roseivirga pacifica]SEW32954.1 Thiopurine S-methyltransferase (TPMT) [Roseivirga pacifica]
MMNELDEKFWSGRYLNETTGWDIGYVSTPLKEYIDQLEDKSLHILIPGAGNAYEAEYLWNNGFINVTVVDLAAEPLSNLKVRVPDFPTEQLIKADFFAYQGAFDLILEQTFFCALNPVFRPAYVQQILGLLKPKGRLVGLLFNIPLNENEPPFGGSKDEYETLFNPYFDIETMEEAHNSIPPRAGNELFIKLTPKSEF